MHLNTKYMNCISIHLLIQFKYNEIIALYVYIYKGNN